MKTQRQAKILEIIASYDIETQEQLLDALQMGVTTMHRAVGSTRGPPALMQ